MTIDPDVHPRLTNVACELARELGSRGLADRDRFSRGHPAERGTFEFFLAAMDRPDLADDPRFATVADRIEHYAELRQILVDFASTIPDADTFEEVFADGEGPDAAPGAAD